MAFYQDLNVDQGSDFALELHLTEVDGSKKDLTNYTVEAQMKRSYSSVDSDEIFSFNSIIASPGTDGIIVLELPNETTDALNYKKRYVYDVEIAFLDSDSNSIVERVLEGKVNVNPSVTR